MQLSHLHYFPLPLPFFSMLVGIFLLLVGLLRIGGVALRIHAPRYKLRRRPASAPRNAGRQLFQHPASRVAGAGSTVRARDRFLRDALRSASGRRMARDGHSGKCRRSAHSGFDVALFAFQTSPVAPGSRRDCPRRCSVPPVGPSHPWTRYRIASLRSRDDCCRGRASALAQPRCSARLYQRKPGHTHWCGSAQSGTHSGSCCANSLDRRSGDVRRNISDRYPCGAFRQPYAAAASRGTWLRRQESSVMAPPSCETASPEPIFFRKA
ncbi:hypothetical protein OKW38_005599 [Paraburkholderia sp. MM5496-R1]